MEDDYLLDDEGELDEGYYQSPVEESEDDEDDGTRDEVEELEDEADEKADASDYEGRMTADEIWLSSGYDKIVAAGKNDKDNALEVAAAIVVMANPKHTSAQTISNIVKDLFHKQGHSRMVNSIYTPTTPLRGEDVDLDFNQEDDSGFNKKFAEDARDQVARFIEYLASRDLSKDSTISRNRKQRQIPAFIIFLFSSGMYDLIIDCPTLPPEYASQVENAFKEILKVKYDIVEELAKRYEEKGRPAVADRVRHLQLAWFSREPAEIKTYAEYSDLGLTEDDVDTYREYRGKFTNASKALTQDLISDLILVVVAPGVYEKLKDKTRSDAISDVKQVYKNWSKTNPIDSELASKIIWKDVDELKNQN